MQKTIYSNDELYFDFDKNMNIELNINVEKKCSFCHCINNVEKFEKKPCWLFAQSLIKPVKQKITIHDLPVEMCIDNSKFNLFMCTYLVGAHFKSILKLNEILYCFDDMDNNFEEMVPKHVFSSCFYYLLN